MIEQIFTSEGDIEAAILHENKDAFVAIINKDLYSVTGQPPDQNINFHNSSCFDLFSVHVFELLVEQCIQLKDHKECRLSVFTGAKWLADRYKSQVDVTGLIQTIELLDIWLNEEPPCSFWCGAISKQIEFKLSRRKILRFAQLLSKHNLFRLTGVIRNLFEICNKAGCNIAEVDVLHILEPFTEELKTNRLIYHSSYLVEMLYIYFTELNKVAYQLYMRTPTNQMAEMKYPDGISSDTFRNLYYSAVSFAAEYNRAHYDALRPHTTKYLKMRY